jgi:hypothetical protein
MCFSTYFYFFFFWEADKAMLAALGLLMAGLKA